MVATWVFTNGGSERNGTAVVAGNMCMYGTAANGCINCSVEAITGIHGFGMKDLLSIKQSPN